MRENVTTTEWILLIHTPSAEIYRRLIVGSVRGVKGTGEGKAKRTPARGVKKNLKPCTYKQWEHRAICVTAYLLYNGSATYIL